MDHATDDIRAVCFPGHDIFGLETNFVEVECWLTTAEENRNLKNAQQKKKPQRRLKMQRERIVCAFVDVSRFGSYAKIASRDPESFESFVRDLYSVFVAYGKNAKHPVKYLGDGLLAISLLVRGHNCKKMAAFLHELEELAVEVNGVIEDILGFPRPGFVRIRCAAGQVLKIYLPDGSTDYIGYALNLTSRLMRVCPEKTLVIHESVKDIVGDKHCFTFTKVDANQHVLDGVEQEDLRALWTFECSKGKERSNAKMCATSKTSKS